MPKPKESFTTAPLRVVRESSKAILFDPGVSDVVWIPKSQIEDPDIDELQVGTEQEITIPLWLAQEKGLT